MAREKLIRHWTAEDDASLRDLAVRGALRRSMAMRLRRSPHAISARMSKLGIERAEGTPAQGRHRPEGAAAPSSIDTRVRGAKWS